LKPTIGIIGTGKVGSTLARLWCKTGYSVVALYNRTPAKAEALLAYLPDAEIVGTPAAIINLVDIAFVTVTDDAVRTVAEEIVNADWQGKAVVHTSGALSIDPLQNLADKGAMVGSLHPAIPFADVDSAMKQLSGATFALEAYHPMLQQWLMELVHVLNGQIIMIPAGQKALYHAALAIASNYTVTLYAIAQALLISLGAERSVVNNALNVLVEATVENIRQQGIPQALTGPLSRADVTTIQSHLAAIDDETLRRVYKGLARLSVPMLEQRGVNVRLLHSILQDLP
jgi:predicted short-subunit dehydrogenase-like oxidoreductase (DUF2520 family)